MAKEYYAGVDVGSTYVKIVLLDDKSKLIGYRVAATGINGSKTASELLDNLYKEYGVASSDINAIIATGYGRRMIKNVTGTATELKAHASGALWTAPKGSNIRSVIDIGGQDSKAIILDEQGEMKSFVMNDKCAAGTGRFLEALARVLKMDIEELGSLSLQATYPCPINSTCVVFAESELISLLARGTDVKDIIAGIHASMAKRIIRMARSAGLEDDLLLTGGGALNPGLVAAFQDELLKVPYVSEYSQLNGAIGAALLARKHDLIIERKISCSGYL